MLSTVARETIIFIFILLSTSVLAQSIGPSIPKQFKSSDKFLFYLHGGVVTVLGDNAINQGAPEWGPYEYSKILDSLRVRGFNVISEIRKDGIPDSVYVNKIELQLDTLIQRVRLKNILLLGASAGNNIVLNVASKMKIKNLKVVMMGGCWPDTYKEYLPIPLYGKFLSIIETTDPHGTCNQIFEGRKTIRNYEELKLNTGLSHGFICKGHKEWIDPVTQWFKNH
jgi:hypothetical protein